ncbi:MAG: hypothetical protein LQ350_005652 [Teloschistes chrysophthalmus]|nr:MAG: hypothetical protein LQ350_005652 [Niorma chrysophthalma]
MKVLEDGENKLGIQRYQSESFGNQNQDDREIISYSSVIEFKDKTIPHRKEVLTDGNFSAVIEFRDKEIPHNKEILTDAKLLNLAIIAYDEMVKQAKAAPDIGKYKVPGAMAGCAYKGRVFFCSSVKPLPTFERNLPELPKGCVREFMDRLEKDDMMTHTKGAGCGEISMMEALWFYENEKCPDRGPLVPRIAIWLRAGRAKIGEERNAYPCSPDDDKVATQYGCSRVVHEFGIEPIDHKVEVDREGEEEWDFIVVENKRQRHK